MKNVRNPHIFRTLLILYFFGLSKIFCSIIWPEWCLNRSVTLRRWSNEIRKNWNPKILKNYKGMNNVRNFHILRTLLILHFFGLFKDFWGIFWLGCCLNRFFTLRRWPNDIRKNGNPKLLKHSQGYEEYWESSHSSFPPNSPLPCTF